jgi:hypothetical protein
VQAGVLTEARWVTVHIAGYGMATIEPELFLGENADVARKFLDAVKNGDFAAVARVNLSERIV